MKIIIAKDYDDLSYRAADIIAAQVVCKRDSVLGLATGSTFCRAYDIIANRKNGLDFSQIRTVNLDEYVGLEPADKNSYRYFMDTNLFDRINIQKENTYLPDGLAQDLDKECKRYDAVIKNLGGIDLQLLGLGMNGHIGFNEPAEHFEPDTNCVTLRGSTRAANSRFFQSVDDVPKKAITMGIKQIMQAKKVLLCVSGAAKREILHNVLYGIVTPSVPASILRLHADVTVIADRDAFGKIDEEVFDA